MGQEHKRFREFRTPFPCAWYPQKSSQHVCACAAGKGAICSKNRIKVLCEQTREVKKWIKIFFALCLTHWLPELFAKRRFLDILVVFGLDLSQITFNLVTNALASRQLGFLATAIAFCDIFTRVCAEIKTLRPTSLGFSIFGFFSPFLFFSFCCSDWPSTGVACG